MSHYKPYPAYKDSGVEWIGKVPEHWQVKPVYSVATVRNGYPFASELFKSEGVESNRLIRIRDIAGDDESIFTEEACPASAAISNGDVLIGMDGDFNVHRWMRGPAKLNQRMCTASGRTEEVTQFLSRCLPIPLQVINDLAYATTVKHLSSYEVLHTRIAVPPTHELANINAALDRETTRIDALIAKKTEFIGLLAKKRQALITHAVTKGLNPKARMKYSGVEWIGEVPEHWRVCSLGYLSRIATGGTPDRKNDSYWNGSIPWIKTGEINYKVISDTEERITSEGLENSAAFVAEPGTILMAMYGMGVTRGRVAILGIASSFNQACAAISCGSGIHNWYVYHCLCAAYRFIRDLGNEASQVNLNLEIISKIKIPFPPTCEQERIVCRLEKQLVTMDAIMQRVSNSIDLLKKRRSALITAAVTGQINLREST